MTREPEGWVVLVRSGAAKRGDRWTPHGDVALEERFALTDKGGTTVMQRKSEQPPREATIIRQQHVAKAMAADVQAAGAQCVVLPVRASGTKMVGAEVENLSAAAEALWETKGA